MKYLTKSRFKIGLECATKLYYTGKKEYANTKLSDTFLESLAEGGFQVGELAKDYFNVLPECDIKERGYDEALNRTNKLLENENVVISEAAFKYNNLFIRADIIVKRGNSIELHEVKAKSFGGDDKFWGKKKIDSGWAPYIYDVAFQKYVITKAFPSFKVKAFLFLANKDSISPSEGLHQVYKIERLFTEDKLGVKQKNISIKRTRALSEVEMQDKILAAYPMDDYIDLIWNSEDGYIEDGKGFEERILEYARIYAEDEFHFESLKPACAKCEFKNNDLTKAQGLKSGFEKCFLSKYQKEDLNKPLTFELWGGGDTKLRNEIIRNDKFFFDQINSEDVFKESYAKAKIEGVMHHADRKWHQIESTLAKSKEPVVYKEMLREEMASWHFPLHMIDFETSRVAIPFNKGSRPYHQVAFQFSHHIIHKDGRIEHAGEWLNTEAGYFPNFDFLRKLKAELDKDEGTIFRYSNHENTVLNEIKSQLLASNETDKNELCNFIETITNYADSSTNKKTQGHRNMVDLLEVIKSYYWHPLMKGSNSIKHVLPSILNDSDYLKEKYSKPIYGNGIVSKNFKDKIWIVVKDGKVSDPYKALEPISENVSEDEITNWEDSNDSDDVINNGGAAMMIYAEMQFMDIPSEKRKAIEKSLLKYCELDTLAMVMIYEYLSDITK